MQYIGVHRGTINDGYVCSSKSMLSEFKKRPEDFSRRILCLGSFAEMLAEEERLLSEINAVDNPLFYNKSNGNKKFGTFDKLSENHKEKIRLSCQNRKHDISETGRARIVAAWKGKKRGKQSKEHLEKLSAVRKGRKHSDVTKQLMAKNHRGGWQKGVKHGPLSNETKEKIRQTLLMRNRNANVA
jgi:hypothetical protein